MMPLDVVIVANDIGPVGGMERQLTELATGLARRGHAVEIVARTCELPPDVRVRWRRVRVPGRPFAIAYPLFLLVALLRTPRRPGALVHSTGALLLRRHDVCTVHLCHRALAHQRGLVRASRDSLPFRLNAKLAGVLARWAEGRVIGGRLARRVVGVSEGVSREVRDEYPAAAPMTTTIPNGVDTARFHPAEERAPGRRAIFVGGEWERKGLRHAIEALAHAPGWTLRVVGPGDHDAYGRLAVAAGVADRVDFLGPRTDVEELYRECDAFVFPSAYETFSLVTYEAAASGLPLLSTRVSGIEDVLRDGENGWFVERDGESIGRRLVQLEGLAPDALGQMRAAARESVLGYSWEAVVDAYEKLYAELRDDA
jgi:glycosyltransferase involved in cell wall biosynthesis